jgi:hypothetical protein
MALTNALLCHLALRHQQIGRFPVLEKLVQVLGCKIGGFLEQLGHRFVVASVFHAALTSLSRSG